MENLMNQGRFRKQGKSKGEQFSKVKQTELDYSKQELMDQNRQDGAKQSAGLYGKLKGQTAQNEQDRTSSGNQLSQPNFRQKAFPRN